MKKSRNYFRVVFILLIIFTFSNLHAQKYELNKNINKDSLLKEVLKSYALYMKIEILKDYNEANDTIKEYILFMCSMPKSSKKKLIKNYENKKLELFKLKEEYKKIVPENYVVYIEFEQENIIFTIPKSITIKIYKDNDTTKKKLTDDSSVVRNDNLEVISQNWDMEYGSKELDTVLQYLNWTTKTLDSIKILLDSANCMSIENGEITTIGYARSGMGLYSYDIFENNLNEKQKEEYNNGCEYIYYKDNIVLEYGGGATGPQCFEKE